MDSIVTIFKKTVANIMNVLNKYNGPNIKRYSPIDNNDDPPTISINMEAISVYQPNSIGWELNNFNKGGTHTKYLNINNKIVRKKWGKQRYTLIFKNQRRKRTASSSSFIPYAGVNNDKRGGINSGHGYRPPNKSLPNPWPPAQIYKNVTLLSKNLDKNLAISKYGIQAIQIENSGYYNIQITRTIRDQYQTLQKVDNKNSTTIDVRANNYKNYIYILIFKSGSSYTDINAYLGQCKKQQQTKQNFIPLSDDKILKYTPSPGNSCTVLLDSGDIIIGYSTKKIGEITFSGKYIGKTSVCTFSKSASYQLNN
jgi:hypothetical protein